MDVINCNDILYRQGFIQVETGIHADHINVEVWNVRLDTDITGKTRAGDLDDEDAIQANTEIELNVDQAKSLVAQLQDAIAYIERHKNDISNSSSAKSGGDSAAEPSEQSKSGQAEMEEAIRTFALALPAGKFMQAVAFRTRACLTDSSAGTAHALVITDSTEDLARASQIIQNGVAASQNALGLIGSFERSFKTREPQAIERQSSTTEASKDS